MIQTQDRLSRAPEFFVAKPPEGDMAEIKKVSDEELEKIRKLIESLKYGSVNIIIQDGKIVQIDKNEKIRL